VEDPLATVSVLPKGSRDVYEKKLVPSDFRYSSEPLQAFPGAKMFPGNNFGVPRNIRLYEWLELA
jgi:hypothetical protein